MFEDMNVQAAYPEIFLAVAAMALLMVGVFRGEGSTRIVSWLSVLVLLITLILVLQQPDTPQLAFASVFVNDSLANFAKILILIGAAAAIIMSLGFIRREGMYRFEFPILFLLATLGMMMMVSANDLVSLYMGIEVQSLALYVVAAFQRDNQRATEAGLKYFVLGALSSGMLLYGCSLIYGFTGNTLFPEIAAQVKLAGASGFQEGVSSELGLLVGIVFLTAGLAFKVSAVPFHMWTPDVYEGAPTPVTAFFATAPKVAALILFLRTMMSAFDLAAVDWQQIIIFISVLSMVLGAFAAIAQRNIKRLMAYSSIGHVGYALIGLAAGSQAGVQGVLIYLAIYLVMNIGTFSVILCMRRGGSMVEGIDDLAGLGKTNPLMALALAIFMFSMAGIPWMAGFFGKLYIFMAAVDAELYALAIIGVLSSVVGAFYYLRIVKLMYFDDASEPFEAGIDPELKAIIAVSAVFIFFFIVYPSPIISGAEAAVSGLLK